MNKKELRYKKIHMFELTEKEFEEVFNNVKKQKFKISIFARNRKKF